VVGLDGEGGFGGPACDGRGVSSDYMVLMEGNVVNSVFFIFVSIYLHPVFFLVLSNDSTPSDVCFLQVALSVAS